MKSSRLVLIALLLALPFTVAAKAQIGVGIGVGPEVAPAPEAYGPPVCQWGYYSSYPYDCARTAITGRSGFMAAPLSALDRGTAGADVAGVDTAIAAATDTAADTGTAAVADMPDVHPMAA